MMDHKPYTMNMFAIALKETETFLEKCFEIFMELGLLGQENGTYFIINWEKHQSADRLDKIREQDRLRKRRQREKGKILTENCHGDSHVTVTQQNKNKKENQIENKNILYHTPNEWEQMIARYCGGLPEDVRQETNCLLQTFLSSLKNKGKLLSPAAWELTLEKLIPMAKESELSLPAYLKEVLCRGWKNFYPIPSYQQLPPQKESSYSIEEIESFIIGNERGINQ